MSRGSKIFLVDFRHLGSGPGTKFLGRPLSVIRVVFSGGVLGQALPSDGHDRFGGHGNRANVAGIEKQIVSGSSLDITPKLGMNPIDRNHFAQLIGAAIHHCHVVVGSLARRHQAFVLKIAITRVGPYGGDFRRNVEIALLHQARSFLPQTGDEFCIGPEGANDLDLVGNRLGDQFAQGFVIAPDARVKISVTGVREPAQTYGPQHFLARRIRSRGVLPRPLKNFGVAGVRVGNVLGPARDIEPQGNSMMLRQD